MTNSETVKMAPVTGGTRGWLGLSLTSLRWLAIVVPLVFLALVQYLLHAFLEVLHEWPWVIILFGTVAAAVASFSFWVFNVIERLERRVLEQSEEVARRNRELAALLAVGEAGRSAVRLGDVVDAALDAVLAVTSAEAAEVWLVTESSGIGLERLSSAGAGEVTDREHLRFGEGLPGIAAQTGEPVVVHDVASDSRSAPPLPLPVKGSQAVEAGDVGEIEEIKPGQTKRVTMKLQPGKYVLLCNLPGHYKAGQYAALRVR